MESSHFYGTKGIKKGKLNQKEKKKDSPCSLRAVKMMVPVSSPMRHSAMRVGRRLWEEEGLPLFKTVLDDNTFATKVWPLVPGFSWSTFVNTGFRFAGFSTTPLPSCCWFDAIDQQQQTSFDQNSLLLLVLLFPCEIDWWVSQRLEHERVINSLYITSFLFLRLFSLLEIMRHVVWVLAKRHVTCH